MEALNELLPESDRLPPLKLAEVDSQRYPTIDHGSGTIDDSDNPNLNITPEKYEYRVIDKD